MSVRINDIAPDFTAESTAGLIKFHDWLDGGYAIIFSHPRDFTPVCTTEFGAVAQLAAEWTKRNTKVIGVSVDSVEEHHKWKRDIESFGGAAADFPIIDDTSLTVSKAFDMLPAEFYLPEADRTCGFPGFDPPPPPIPPGKRRPPPPPIRQRCARSISSGQTKKSA